MNELITNGLERYNDDRYRELKSTIDKNIHSILEINKRIADLQEQKDALAANLKALSFKPAEIGELGL
jgi:uncharacterized small protein (DUF1192 family)